MNHVRVGVSLFILACCISASAWAFVDGPVEAGPYAMVQGQRTLPMVSVEVDEARQQELRALAAWSRFSDAHQGRWHVDFDLMSLRPRRMLGKGIPMLPGEKNALTLGDLPTSSVGPVKQLTHETLEAVA